MTQPDSQHDTIVPNAAAPPQTTTCHEFVRLGWCPHQVRKLQQVHTPALVAHLSRLDRRGYRPNSHDACAQSPRCIANNVDLNHYNTAHAPPCAASCTPLAVDYDAVTSIIRDGGVPLVSIHVDLTSTAVLSLRVTSRTPSSRYTVLSHVWFDGLGNPSANALPLCQIERLYKQLITLPRDHESGAIRIGALEVDWLRQSFVMHPDHQPPLFWMGTLCIPVGETEKALRQKAINQMASIYAAAVQELVLDAELLQCEAGSGTVTDALARITSSAWMTRSWTLQEGVLARECIFQFRDRAVDPVHEWSLNGLRFANQRDDRASVFPDRADTEQWAVYRELYNTFWDTLHQDWKSNFRRDPPTPAAYKADGGAMFSLFGFRGSKAVGKVHTLPTVEGLSKRGRSGLDRKDHFTMQLGDEHRVKQFVDSWNELAHRSTTMPEDLHVIIANLLDFNADRIMELATREERMRAILLSFNMLPVSLFWNTGSRWSSTEGDGEDCNRWIPVEPSKSQLTLTPVMLVTDQWLKLDLDASDSTLTRAEVLGIKSIRPEQGLTFMFSHPRTAILYEMSLLGDETDFTNDDPVSTNFTYTIILERSQQLSAEGLIRGALFRPLPPHSEVNGEELQLVYYCPVQLRCVEAPLSPPIQMSVAELIPTGTSVAVKYNTIKNFVPHPRRISQGATLRGMVTILILAPIPITLGIGCLVAFIVIMARQPHNFSPTAKGLLAAFLVLYVGVTLISFAWMMFITPVMYRMWLASFESSWVENERKGWWGRYVRLEKWLGRMEGMVYAWIKEVLKGKLTNEEEAVGKIHTERKAMESKSVTEADRPAKNHAVV